MISEKIKIQFVSTTDPQVSALIRTLDDYQKKLYPAESNHLMAEAELEAPDCKILGALIESEVVGIGACKFFDSYAELKRFYVIPEERRFGVAGLIIEGIENLIRMADLPLARLETGINQPEALAFYRRAGYKERGPFGGYKVDPQSVFMEKIIL